MHPIAEKYILSPPEERIAVSVKRQGTIEPVTTYEDMLLDGRIRDKSNLELGLPRWAVRFEDTPQGLEAIGLGKKAMDRAALEYVIAKNMERHHYTQGQLAMMAYRMADMAQGARTDLIGEPSAGLPKVSQAEAARICGVSVRLMGNAGRIDREGTPEQIRAVETGMPLEPIVAAIIKAKEKARLLELPAPSLRLLLDNNGNPILNQIICGDAPEVLKTLPDRCVDTIITSHPYFGLRDYGMERQIGLEETPELYIQALVKVLHESRRVLADDGTLWTVIADSYAGSGRGPTGHNGIGNQTERQGFDSPRGDKLFWLKPKDLIGIPFMLAFALRADGWYWRDIIIWHKPDPMPESVTDRKYNLALAGLEMLTNVVVVLVPVGLGHQHLDVLPDQLGCVVSEQLFGSRVDALDNAYRIDGNDRIHGRP